jgi:hypothetical protein
MDAAADSADGEELGVSPLETAELCVAGLAHPVAAKRAPANGPRKQSTAPVRSL